MLAIFKVESIKFIKNPWSIIFGIFFPIMWILIDGFVWGKNSVNGINVMNYVFPGIVLLVASTFTISTISLTLSNDRINKRLKQISITKIGVTMYLFGIVLWNYIVFICDFVLIFLIATFAFELKVSFLQFLFLIIVPLFLFITNFFMAVSIANNSKTTNSNTFITILIFYITIFLSGSSIPTYIFPDWYKWIQIFIPSGSPVLLLTYLSNGINTTEIWYTYLIMIAYILIFGFIAIKTFKWQ
ncbi:hypothetical protein SLITO_v1c04450 [Spiroplasma litorale]|uniref:ABC transmembrane type-2 domain-containing protein n=1 Tax=Spiroplasma litorale TaxID=216942 RepID=A0A0K1W1P9_9MOLU|nr:ABC transporter permease [Spiroplasma litorale]AKX34098.1 hypothetical protein SLITO_v1c04450 [Spiroplasma litorale]